MSAQPSYASSGDALSLPELVCKYRRILRATIACLRTERDIAKYAPREDDRRQAKSRAAYLEGEVHGYLRTYRRYNQLVRAS